tara:strand:- start:82 stop:375 length:294 start_codon:yes stop_codon:yes gene_type:complete
MKNLTQKIREPRDPTDSDQLRNLSFPVNLPIRASENSTTQPTSYKSTRVMEIVTGLTLSFVAYNAQKYGYDSSISLGAGIPGMLMIFDGASKLLKNR